MLRPGRFAPGKDSRYPFYRRLGEVPLPVWTVAENLVSTGIRYLDRPAHSESLYRLSYPSPIIILVDLQGYMCRLSVG